MYKIFIFIFICIYSIFPAFSQTIVNGKIEGLKESGVNSFYLFSIQKQKNIDTIMLNGDNFSFLINQTTPEFFMFGADNQKLGFTCWIQNTDSIKIIGNLNELIVPTKTSELFIKRIYNNLQKIGSIEQSIHDSFFSSIEKPLKEFLSLLYDNDDAFYTEEKSNKLKKLKIEILKALISQIKNEPNSQATQFAIFYLDKDLGIFTKEQKEELNIVIDKHIDKNTPKFDPL